ncbi:MAG TPA: hypothetical protein VH722_15615 [Alphaproteobacteria bacterium]|jgi:hypothetical protein|nr:hypothetical protein [Alphaproteobacteria bacterium]
MADTVTASLTNVVNFITAAGGLGTAAMGLVDALKAFRGGPSNLGFGYIGKAVHPFLPAGGGTRFTGSDAMQTLKANWMNGVPTADQKAKAKALIHLGITPANAPALAGLAGVNPVAFTDLATNVANGDSPTANQINTLGQFDVVLGAILDTAYERADQKYRNGCKLLATIISVALGLVGGYTVFGADGYLWGPHFWLSGFVGLIATPLAPVAKDLVSSLQASANAIGFLKR